MRRCFFHFSSSAAGISTQLHQHALRTGREIIHACRIKKDAENVEHLAFQRERAAGKLQFRGHQSWSCRIIAPSLVAAFKSFHRQGKDGSFQAFLPGRFKFLRQSGRQDGNAAEDVIPAVFLLEPTCDIIIHPGFHQIEIWMKPGWESFTGETGRKMVSEDSDPPAFPQGSAVDIIWNVGSLSRHSPVEFVSPERNGGFRLLEDGLGGGQLII